jgi:hypothetical protein
MNFYLELDRLILPVKSLNEKILLGLIQWYMPDEIRVLTSLWLDEHWGSEHKTEKSDLLSSKLAALGFLLEQDRWNERDFFGNILRVKLIWYFLDEKRSFFQNRNDLPRVKKKVYRRGYNDKHTLRKPHKSIRYDYRKLKDPLQVEEKRELEKQEILNSFRKIQDRLRAEGITERIKFRVWG